MTTAMITNSFTGLVRVLCMLLTVVILAEFIYHFLFSQVSEEARGNDSFNPSRSKLLFSEVFCNTKENSVCNPYRFKKPKLIAQAMGFIFFIHPGRDRFAFVKYACNNHSLAGNNYSSAERFFNSDNNFFSIHPRNDHATALRQNDVTGKTIVNGTLQNLTTCL